MASYVDVFGGSPVQPAELSYRAVTLSANTQLEWPFFTSGNPDNPAARIMDVTPTLPGLSLSLPPADQVSEGQDVLLTNKGAQTFTVLNADGDVLGTVAAGQAKYFYLQVNTDAGGSWAVVAFGVGASSVDAAALAGFGLKAIGATLNQKYTVNATSSDVNISASFRASAVTFTGGSNNCNLPGSIATGNDFFFLVKNAGSGAVTVLPSGVDTIDSGASLVLNPSESCMVINGGLGAWYTVGLGKNVMFAFSQLVKSISGAGTVTLTAAECSNKLITFVGVLTGDRMVNVISSPSPYFIKNSTTGAFIVTIKTAVGTGVSIDQGLRDILVCDGTNVEKAITNTATTTAFNSGSASNPPITFVGDTNTGIYRASAEQVGITGGGVAIAVFDGSVVAPVNQFKFASAATLTTPTMSVTGTDTDVGLTFKAKGVGDFFFVDGSDNEVLRLLTTPSAVNEVTIINAITTAAPVISVTGVDSTISLLLEPKGPGYVILGDANGNEVVRAGGVASAVNEITFTNAITAASPSMLATGADANISLLLGSKGTGAVTLTQGAFNTKTAADVVSAATTPIDVIDGNCVTVTGSNDITAFTLADGHWRFVRFTGSLRISNNLATLICPFLVDLYVTPGTTMTIVGTSAGVYIKDLCLPTGTFKPGFIKWQPYAGTEVGWGYCDGSAVSRTDSSHSGLFAVMGITWGPGDGATTYNLPDLRGVTITGDGQIVYTQTVATSVAANAQLVASNQYFVTGLFVRVSSSGVLPTGLAAGTDYLIKRVDATHISFYTTIANLQNDVVAVISAGSGNITITTAGTTTQSFASFTVADKFGEQKHYQTLQELINHTHPQEGSGLGGGSPLIQAASNLNNAGIQVFNNTSFRGGATPFNVQQPSAVGRWMIKL